MGIDKSLNDDYPSIIINGTRYHFGRDLAYGDYLVENAHYAKDYWSFWTPEDMLAFLVNLPESADRHRMLKLYPDWHEVTPEQRDAYFEDSSAKLRAAMEEKQKAGTAWHFPVYPDDGSGPYRGHEPFRIESKELPLARVERTISDFKRYQEFGRGLTEAGKLSVLERLDWSGVRAADKEAILQREVDFGSITKEQFEFVYEDIRLDSGWRVSDEPARKLWAAVHQEQAPAPGTVHFHGFDCEVEQRSYSNGRMALVLVDAKDREQVAVATVNLPEAPLQAGDVFIKDYSENEGMLQALEKAGIVQATGETVRSGFVEVPVAKVLSPTHRRDRQDDRDKARANESVVVNESTNQMPGASDAYKQMLRERAVSAIAERNLDKGIER